MTESTLGKPMLRLVKDIVRAQPTGVLPPPLAAAAAAGAEGGEAAGSADGEGEAAGEPGAPCLARLLAGHCLLGGLAWPLHLAAAWVPWGAAGHDSQLQPLFASIPIVLPLPRESCTGSFPHIPQALSSPYTESAPSFCLVCGPDKFSCMCTACCKPVLLPLQASRAG